MPELKILQWKRQGITVSNDEKCFDMKWTIMFTSAELYRRHRSRARQLVIVALVCIAVAGAQNSEEENLKAGHHDIK
jgi:hypothetical protein